MNKKMISILLFAVLCGLVVAGFMFGESTYKSFNKGPYADQVTDGKPTVYVFVNNEELEKSSSQYAGQVIASIGREYQEQISIQTMDLKRSETLLSKGNISIDVEASPSLVIVNKNGYVVAVHEGLLNLDQIRYDIQQLVK